MAYSAVIGFISGDADKALAIQTPSGTTVQDGYRLLHSTSFSTKTVGQTISYNYVGGDDDNAITIL